VPPNGPYEIRDGATTDTVSLLAAAGLESGVIDALLKEGVIA
jgi:hypothetical protein